MADKQDKPNPPAALNMTAINTGMLGFAIPMPVPVFTPQVMPIRMMPPFWPTNSASFMHQYMEAMRSGVAQGMNQISASHKEQPSNAIGDTTSVIPSALDQAPTGQGKRQEANIPRFPNPMLFPFGGFVPFGPYFPCFNTPGNGFGNKQSKDYEDQSAEASQIQDLECNNALEKREVNKEQPLSDCGTKAGESTDAKPVIKCSEVKLQESPAEDSHTHDITHNNSPEMDVAQILVNFMPVPVISGVKPDTTLSPEKSFDVSPSNKTIIKESVLLSPPTRVNVISTASPSLAASAEISSPENTSTVEHVSSSCVPVTKKDPPSSVSLIKNTTAKQPEQQPLSDFGLKSEAMLNFKKQQMSAKNNNNYIVNSNTSMAEQFNPKHEVKTSDTVRSSTVIQLVRSQNTNPPQEDQPSAITYVKSESQDDVKMQTEITEDKPVELVEMSNKSEEYQQDIFIDDENAIPPVDDLLKGDLGSDKSTYKCEVCAQLFRSSLGLQKHLEFHMDDGQHYTCTICFQPFKEAKTLDDHIALHMRNRPHKCTFCPKAFRDPGSLQKHVRVHTGEKPYKCTSCYQSFAEYSSLRKHLRVHTGEQPYRCQYCDKAFSISGNLQRHVLIHTGERPYKCSFCPKAFNNPSHLRRHVKNLHFKGEATTGVVEDMISAIHGEVTARVKKSLTANKVRTEGIEHTELGMEISQEEGTVSNNTITLSV